MSDLLAVGPHPDDVELGAGGTLALAAARGFSVAVLDLTRGERGTRGTRADRDRESTEAAKILGVARRRSLELPDGGVDGRSPEAIERLVAVLREERPRLLISLWGDDDHPDHVEGAVLVRRAVYMAGLRNYPRPGATPHRTARVLWAMGRRPFTPSLVVDVSTVYEQKRRALAAYATQFTRAPGDPLVTPISEPDFLVRVESRDRTHGGLIGVPLGEAFLEEGPVAVRDAGALFPEVRP